MNLTKGEIQALQKGMGGGALLTPEQKKKFKSGLKKIGAFLLPLGGLALKEVVFPWLMKMAKSKMSSMGEEVPIGPLGSGLNVAGGALQLAGTRSMTVPELPKIKRTRTARFAKGSQAAKDHMAKIRAMKKK